MFLIISLRNYKNLLAIIGCSLLSNSISAQALDMFDANHTIEFQARIDQSFYDYISVESPDCIQKRSYELTEKDTIAGLVYTIPTWRFWQRFHRWLQVEDQVFVLGPDNETHYVAMDFSLEVGDSLELSSIPIEAGDTLRDYDYASWDGYDYRNCKAKTVAHVIEKFMSCGYDGIERRILRVRFSNDWCVSVRFQDILEEYWIEGVGPDRGFYDRSNVPPFSSREVEPFLISRSEEGRTSFRFQTRPLPWHITTETIGIKKSKELLCAGQSLKLELQRDCHAWKDIVWLEWSNGSNAEEIIISEPGIYWCQYHYYEISDVIIDPPIVFTEADTIVIESAEIYDSTISAQMEEWPDVIYVCDEDILPVNLIDSLNVDFCTDASGYFENKFWLIDPNGCRHQKKVDFAIESHEGFPEIHLDLSMDTIIVRGLEHSGWHIDWLLNDSLIASGELMSFIASEEGNYYVRATNKWGCELISEEIAVLLSTSQAFEPPSFFQSVDRFWVDRGTDCYIRIFDINGAQLIDHPLVAGEFYTKPLRNALMIYQIVDDKGVIVRTAKM